jgi:hypothetical protein
VDGGSGVFATFGVPEVTLWKLHDRSFQLWYPCFINVSPRLCWIRALMKPFIIV